MAVPKVEVRFQNLKVSANVHVGSRALPSLPNYTRNALEVPKNIFSYLLSQVLDSSINAMD